MSHRATLSHTRGIDDDVSRSFRLICFFSRRRTCTRGPTTQTMTTPMSNSHQQSSQAARVSGDLHAKVIESLAQREDHGLEGVKLSAFVASQSRTALQYRSFVF